MKEKKEINKICKKCIHNPKGLYNDRPYQCPKVKAVPFTDMFDKRQFDCMNFLPKG